MQISTKFRFPEEEQHQLPLVGRIVAGEPIEAIEDIEVLDLQEMFQAPCDRFALRVVGDSMIDEHIRDGDFVICQRRNTAQNGDTVVALLADGEATLKTFYFEHGRVRLQPANANYKPIYPDSIDIQGVVIGVIRQL